MLLHLLLLVFLQIGIADLLVALVCRRSQFSGKSLNDNSKSPPCIFSSEEPPCKKTSEHTPRGDKTYVAKQKLMSSRGTWGKADTALNLEHWWLFASHACFPLQRGAKHPLACWDVLPAMSWLQGEPRPATNGLWRHHSASAVPRGCSFPALDIQHPM